MEFLLYILITGLRLSSAYDHPVFLWPMNKNFQGYEVMTQTDACPTSGRCLSVREQSNSNLNEESVLVFDGNSYMDFHINGTNYFNSFVLSYFVKPTLSKSRSVLVHYKADVPDSYKISEFLFEGETNDYVLTVIYGDGTNTVLRCRNDFKLDMVSLLTVWYRHKTGSLEMYSDFGHIHTTHATKSELNVPGRLRFGRHQSLPDTGYVGEMSCASMYRSEDSLVSKENEASICNQNFPAPPTGSVCLDSTDSPALVWPLDDQVYAEEIQMATSPIYPTTKPINKPITGPEDLCNQALRFNGFYQSAIITNIPSRLIQRDFSISMFLLLDVINTGDILRIKGQPTSGIQELKLIIYNNVLILTVINDCGEVKVKYNVTYFNWQTVAMGKSAGDIYLIVNGQKRTSSALCSTTNTCLMDHTGSLDMVIGNSVVNNEKMKEGFKGGITCLSIFRSAQEPFEVKSALFLACHDHGQRKTFTSDNDSQMIRETRQIILRRDVSPPDGASSIESILMTSLVTCGVKCMNMQYCKMYTYSDDGTCMLYDVLIINQLYHKLGTNYYLAD